MHEESCITSCCNQKKQEGYMKKSEKIVLVLIVVTFIVVICYQYNSYKGIKQEIASMEATLSSINDTLAVNTDYLNKMNSDASQLSESISNAVNTDYLNKMNSDAIQLSESIGNKVESVSQAVDYAAKKIETTANKTYDNLLLQTNKLDAINDQLNIKTTELIDYIDKLIGDNSIESMLLFLSNNDTSFDVKDAMYMRIIAQYPSNRALFDEYISFLEDNNAEQLYYYDLHSLLSSALYSTDIEEIPGLLEEISTVNLILEEKNSTGTAVLTDGWSSLYKSFEEEAEDFDEDTFKVLYESLTDYYNILSSTTFEIDSQYQYAQYIFSLYSSYSEYITYANKLLEMNYEDLIRLYSNSNSIWNALMTQFMSRDKNDDGVYLHVIDDMMSSINNKGKAICLRFERLLQEEISEELDSLESKIQENDLMISSYSINDYLSSQINALSSIATMPESFETIKRYSAYTTKYQRALYVAYQEWAAEILSRCEKAKNNVRKENALKELFDIGYFNIDTALLIPQLQSWYNKICTQTVIEKSSIPLESLVGTIHVMGLSDMENVQ